MEWMQNKLYGPSSVFFHIFTFYCQFDPLSMVIIIVIQILKGL